MKYFLDSAKIDEIIYAYNTFGIDGVTTNPKHVMASGKPFLTVVKELSDWAKSENLDGYEKFPISVEINPHLQKKEDLVAAAEKIAKVSPNFCIKIPCCEEGVAQAIIAAKNGSLFVSPFIGWKEDNGEDCVRYIDDIVKIYKNYGYYGKTQIICAAVRTPKQIVDCAVAGADIVTAGLQVFKNSFYHPYTDSGLKIFSDAWDNTVTE